MGTGLPSSKAVCDLLGNLLGRLVTSSPGDRVEINFEHPGLVAVYVDDALAMHALVLFDMPVAAACGAALALLPPRVAGAAIAAGALTDALAENVAEVMNVMTSVLSGPYSPHLRLHRVYQGDELLPNDVARLASLLGRRVDLEVDVAGYGGGQLSIVFA